MSLFDRVVLLESKHDRTAWREKHRALQKTLRRGDPGKGAPRKGEGAERLKTKLKRIRRQQQARR